MADSAELLRIMRHAADRLDQEAGRIAIPAALQPYMCGLKHIERAR